MMYDFPKESLEAIGQIMVNFNLLEVSLQSTIILCINADSGATSRLISNDSFSILLFKFEKMLTYLFPKNDILREGMSLIKELEKINLERNDIIHSFWYVDDNKDVVSIKSLRTPDKSGAIEKRVIRNVKKLNDFSEKIIRIIKKLTTFEDKLISTLDTQY